MFLYLLLKHRIVAVEIESIQLYFYYYMFFVMQNIKYIRWFVYAFLYVYKHLVKLIEKLLIDNIKTDPYVWTPFVNCYIF